MCVEPELSPCVHLEKHTNSTKNTPIVLQKKKLNKHSAGFLPSLRLKEHQTKHTSIISRIFGVATPLGALVKILPRISVGGISVVSVWCRSSAVVEWLVGPCRTNNRATCFFISLGVTGRCSKVCLAATDESGQRRERCKALQGNRTMPLCRDTRPDLSFLRAASVKAIVGALLSLARC